MKNIEPLYNHYREIFSNKFFSKKFDDLCGDELWKCSAIARVWAYKKSVIPDGFDEFNIFDFNGLNRKDQSRILDLDVLSEAKDKICRYCWGVSWDSVRDLELTPQKAYSFFSDLRQILIDRRKRGDNVVIYSDTSGKSGRTFIASLIMKEAILLKMRKTDPSYTYDWIDLSQLKEEASNKDYEFSVYRTCDWLVVDNITRQACSSENQRKFLVDLWNNFFIDRYEGKLPTILVLKFDINDPTFDAEAEFGSGFDRMIQSDRSLLISLSSPVKQNEK
jgi:DNA replication protein DnaC